MPRYDGVGAPEGGGLRILLVIAEAPPIVSGFARVAAELVARFRAAGHTVDVISSNEIPRIEINELRLSSMLWRGVGPILRGGKQYDIVHIHGPTPTYSDVALLLAWLGRSGKRPAIVYTHHCEIALPGKELLCAPYNVAHRLLARLADHVVVSTPGYASSFERFLPPARVSTIAWGVTLRQAPPRKPDGFNVLFVGQLRPYKGLEVLLQAFQGIEHAQLTVIGDGYRADHYKALTRELGLRNVHFLGSAPENVVRQAYREAHVLVLPSLTRAEAFGLVLLEAMTAGCVPIASELPGLTDVIGEAGYTFEPGDSGALAALLRSLQNNRAKLERLAILARERGEHFSWDTAAQAYERLFVGLVEERASFAGWAAQPAADAVARQPTAPIQTRNVTALPTTPIDMENDVNTRRRPIADKRHVDGYQSQPVDRVRHDGRTGDFQTRRLALDERENPYQTRQIDIRQLSQTHPARPEDTDWRLVGAGLAGLAGALASLTVLVLIVRSGMLRGLDLASLVLNLPLLPAWGALIGYPMVVLISIIGMRFLLYFDNFFFHWPRYRQLERITTDTIRELPYLPWVKVQVTTRGTPGSTEVIRRGIQNVRALVDEAPELYAPKVSVEVITESAEQKPMLEEEFKNTRLSGAVVVLPPAYQTPKGTKLKARSLHYMVELRRQGFNRKPGRTFILHFDEESVMEPDELRKLIHYLATTDKRLTEGPIYYPLEYTDASIICRAMEANRPIGCFECQEVMESGTPLHLHGSNLVVEESLENELGWDIGTLDGQPFIAEDFVFGALAFVKEGPEVFGWHGAVMLEQPPFSFNSAFRQRFRWVMGVLQGLTMLQRMPQFHRLPSKQRFHMLWGTRYRVFTFALGLPTGVLSLLYLLYQALMLIAGRGFLPLPLPIMVWLVLVGFLWLNSVVIGAWYNITSASYMSPGRRWIEAARVLTVAPIAGIFESTAAFWAIVKWLTGHREVNWNPTPKTKAADKAINWEVVQ